ncbi:hypothetical protein Leryth_026680 [Lithospermum erythrorhizon]|nr:hypothetical protein Leryth_026680 [Lithospermum erythrorhizon]
MAVKSCGVAHSASLMNEKSILDELKGCKEIISCLGDCYSFENGEKLYNVLLEYASGGNLADKIKNSNDHRLPEIEVRQYTKAILGGLEFIHKNGYVHCDIKTQNILLGQNFEVKIADFGLAKRGHLKDMSELRGTPLYMSPEMVTGGEQGCPSDIWALGCVVVEMITGVPAWRCSNMASLLMKIGVGEQVPEIPGDLSDELKDFLGKCFEKDPKSRPTAKMLLDHPFLVNINCADHDSVTLKDFRKLPSTSPRCPFDFPNWVSGHSSITYSNMSSPSSTTDFDWSGGKSSSTVAERLKGLVCKQGLDWSVGDDDWVTIR